MTNLPIPSGWGNESGAYGINNSGQVVGVAYHSVYGMQGFLYSVGNMIALSTLAGDGTQSNNQSSVAYAINDRGQIVGSSTYPGGSASQHAFLYSNGQMIDLGNIYGGSTGDSRAYGINDKGQIVGGSDFERGSHYMHAFLYSDGKMQDIGSLGLDTAALSINNNGQIVGFSYTGDDFEHAFVSIDGIMYDLNDLVIGLPDGVSLLRAQSINDYGWIVGYTSNDRAFLLKPVPIPSALLLFGTGLLRLVAWTRRRRE